MATQISVASELKNDFVTKATEEANDLRQMLDDLHEKFDRKSEVYNLLLALISLSFAICCHCRDTLLNQAEI